MTDNEILKEIEALGIIKEVLHLVHAYTSGKRTEANFSDFLRGIRASGDKSNIETYKRMSALIQQYYRNRTEKDATTAADLQQRMLKLMMAEAEKHIKEKKL